MSDTIAPPLKKIARKRPRAWWQWVIGIALIGICAFSLTYRWLRNHEPEWFLQLHALKPISLAVPEGMKEADAIPSAAGSLTGHNVLLITLDTTRADRIGCYGNSMIDTPVMDRLAKQGILFSQAFSTGPTTLPSHCSILTGLYPFHHGARANAFTRLADDQVTMAEVLAGRGYSTGAFVSAFVLNARFGCGQGFSEYDDQVEDRLDPVMVKRDPERRANKTTDLALSWLRRNGDKPFCAWVHYFDPHQPYTPPDEFAERYKRFRYDGEIAYTDSQIGRLMDALNEMKLADKTLVVVIGDHGQGFLQHLELTHGLFVYDSTLQVPFILSCGSKWGGLHISRPVSCVDVMPTVLSLLGVEGPAKCDGEDLTRAAKPGGRAILGETLEGLDQYAVAPLLTLREGAMKYIHGPDPELYDLSADPNEENNLVADRSDLAAKMKDRLSEFYGGDLAKAAHVANAEQLTQEELAQLRALGYIGGEGGALVPDAASLPDPKSVDILITKCERAFEVRTAEGLDAGIAYLRGIVEEAPEYYAVHRLMATFLLDSEQYQLALEPLNHCLSIHPDIPFPLLHLARIHYRLGNIEEAIAYYEKTLKATPNGFDALVELGRILLRRNQPRKAAEYFRKAVLINPLDQTCIEHMSMAMAQSGETDEAISFLQSRLQKNPNSLIVRNALCGLLMEKNRCDELIPLMREGLRQSPDSAPMINNFAYAIIKCKPPQDSIIEAAMMMEKLCAASKYESAEYLRTLGLVYAELFRYDEAISVTEKALLLARQKNQPLLAQDLSKYIALYKDVKSKGYSPMTMLKNPPPNPTSRPASAPP